MRCSRQICLGFLFAAAIALQACSGSGDGSSGKGQIRLLNASIGYDSLDLYVSTDDDDEDTREIEAVESGSVSEYVKVNSDTYTIKIKRNGIASTLLTLTDIDLTDDSHTTFVAYGRSGELLVELIDEDLGEPDPDLSKLGLLNASGSGAVDIYVTDEDDSLDDASPVVETTTFDSGTYRMRVTGSGDKDDLRLDVSGIELASEQVATLILTASPGGVLVNLYFLSQQGNLEKYLNTKSRIRGAVGVASGESATLRVDDVPLLSNAAVGVIGNVYAQVDSGSAAVALTVSGSAVEVDNLVLEAGADYTLLIWNNAGIMEAKLIDDDNFLPEGSGMAKLRLLNGLSAIEAPITLTVDFFPVIEAIELSLASGYVEIDGNLTFQYDVSDATTTTNIWSRDEVVLQDGGVYTLFMSGGDPTVKGSLRRDR